jgi:4-carboxymuconolactone decarboxylase
VDDTSGTGRSGAMPRIRPLEGGELSEQARDLLAFGTIDGVPRSSTLLRTLVRHPDLYRKWVPFANLLLRKSRLSVRERELAILRIAWLCESDFEWGQHVEIALASGVARDELDALTIGSADSRWTSAEKAVIAAAEDLHTRDVISDGTWSDLRASFSPEELLELIFLIGHYNMLAWVVRSLGIPLEEGAHGLNAHLSAADEESHRRVVARWIGSPDTRADQAGSRDEKGG